MSHSVALNPGEDFIYEDQGDQTMVYNGRQSLTRQPFQELLLPEDHDDDVVDPDTERYPTERRSQEFMLGYQNDTTDYESPGHDSQETMGHLFMENEGQADNSSRVTFEDTIYDSDKENKAPPPNTRRFGPGNRAPHEYVDAPRQ